MAKGKSETRRTRAERSPKTEFRKGSVNKIERSKEHEAKARLALTPALSPGASRYPQFRFAVRPIPKGLCPPAQGCEPASYPGKSCQACLNPNGVVAVLSTL